MYKEIDFLVVEDDDALVKVFQRVAKEQNWVTAIARSGTEALEILNRQVVNVAVVDINLPGYNGMQVLQYMKENDFATEVIMMTGVGTIQSAVDAIRMGAYDYMTKPFDDISKVIMQIQKAKERYELLKKIRRYERQGPDQPVYEGMVGKNREMQEIFDMIDNIAQTTSTILVMGESGTGKELVARAIHRRSKRKEKAFVAINCAAISENLLESELFGHKKGSFTGAIQDKKGLFEEADKGSIFLDEISEVSQAVQVKLLRVLQEGEIRPVGGNQSKIVDVRVIAATNRKLLTMVEEGRFREDLYYRLNVISIELPPLRDRVEDIPLLAYHFLQKYSDKLGKKIDKISIDALQAIQSYTWSGNVRELENVMERAAVMATTDTITSRDLPSRILGEAFYLPDGEDLNDLSKLNYKDAKDRALWAFNRTYLTNLLRQTKGNLTIAAEKSGMDRSNFKKIVKKYEVEMSEFRK